MRNSSLKSVPILTFHKVDSSFEWGVTRVAPSRFKTILEFLKKEGYESVSLRTLYDPTGDLPSKPIVLTFDDSYESVYDHAFPLMQEYGFSGTLFVITGYIGRMNEWDVNLGWRKFNHLSWEQIRYMKNEGFEIGSHTVHHPDLTRIDSRQLYLELDRSKKEIEDNIGGEVPFISFPFGRYNQRVIDNCKTCGYQRGCGFWIRKEIKNTKETFVFERKAFYLFDGLYNLKAKLNSSFFTPIEDVKLRIVNFCSHGSSLVKPAKMEFHS